MNVRFHIVHQEADAEMRELQKEIKESTLSSGIVIKALANGFNICFNILSILLNCNVESVCHPLSTLLKRVERMLNRCWKSLKAFKLSFNIHSTFLLFFKMFGMLKRSWSHLPRSFNIVEQAYAQLRRRNHSHVGCKDASKARQFCVWLIVRAGLIFLSER